MCTCTCICEVLCASDILTGLARVLFTGIDGVEVGFSPDDFSMLLEYDDALARRSTPLRSAVDADVPSEKNVWLELMTRHASPTAAQSVTETKLSQLFSQQNAVHLLERL